MYIDNDRDGVFDFAIFNLENGGFGVTGQNVVAVFNLKTNTAVVRFFADTDLDSGNFIATALLSDLGLTPTSQFDFSVFAFDNYFTGDLTDAIESMTYTLSLPRFVGSGVPADRRAHRWDEHIDSAGNSWRQGSLTLADRITVAVPGWSPETRVVDHSRAITSGLDRARTARILSLLISVPRRLGVSFDSHQCSAILWAARTHRDER